MSTVTDSTPPTLADVKRQLKNVDHELGELLALGGIVTRDSTKYQLILAAQHRVREAVAHIEAAERE